MSIKNLLVGVIVGVAAAFGGIALLGLATMTAVSVGVAAGSLAMIGSEMFSMKGMLQQTQSGDQSVTLGSTTDPKTVLPVVFGDTRIGTICVYKGLAHGNDSILVQVFAVCEGEIDHFRNVYMDNKRILRNDSPREYRDGVVPRELIVDQYRGVVELEFRVGKNPNTNLKLAEQYLGSDWDHRYAGNGIATMCIVMHRSEDALMDGVDILQPNSQVSVDIRGLKIANLETGAIEPSFNPVDQIFHYLTNQKYGLRVELDKIDLEAFKAARIKVRQLGFESHGGCDPNASFKDNLINLQRSFGGVIYESFGRMTLKLDTPDIVKHVFNDDNILMNKVNLKSGGSNGYFNTLNVKYQDPAVDYAETMLRYPSDAENDATIIKDGRIISRDLEYRFVKSKAQIDKLASVERNKSRLTKVITFSTTEAYTAQVYDVISVSNTELQLKDSLWRISQIERQIDSGLAGALSITAIEYDSRVYTDLDFAATPDNRPSTMPDSLSVKAPTGLTATAIGQTFHGKNIRLAWNCDDDFNRYGFQVDYRVSGSSNWNRVKQTSQKTLVINQLNPNDSFDFRVCAFGIVARSEYCELLNQNPAMTYTLPAPTLRIRNVGAMPNYFVGSDLIVEWDNQQAEKVMVNGESVPFADLFDHYVIKVTHANGGVAQYKTRDPESWTYTFEMNAFNGLCRDLVIDMYAKGHDGSQSASTRLTALNPQHSAIKGFVAKGGFNSVYAHWEQPTETDYAGTIIQYATSQSFDNARAVQSNSVSHTSFDLEDGDYYLRAGHYDIFGTDSVIWSEPYFLQMKSTISWDDQDKAAVEELLNLQDQLDQTIKDAIAGADQNADIKLDRLHKQITTETGVTVDSAVTELNKVIAEQDKATATKIDQVRVEVDGKIAGVNQQMESSIDNLKGTINSKYNLAVNADGRVAGMHMSASSDPAIPTKVIFTADKFAIAPQNGSDVVPFGVEGNKVYIDSAMIRDGSIGSAQINHAAITNAHIGNAAISTAQIQDGAIDSAKIRHAAIGNAHIAGVIQSDNFHSGVAGWQINKAGGAELNDVTVRGTIYGVDGEFKGTVWANRIEGDLVQTMAFPKAYNLFKVRAGSRHILRVPTQDYPQYLSTNAVYALARYNSYNFRLWWQGSDGSQHTVYQNSGLTGNLDFADNISLGGITVPALGRGGYYDLWMSEQSPSTSNENQVIRSGDQISIPFITLAKVGKSQIQILV